MIRRLGKKGKILLVLILVVSVSGASAVTPTETTQDIVLAVLPAPAEHSKAMVIASAQQIANESVMLPVREAHAGNKENLFSGHSWYTPPPPPPVRKAAPVRRGPVAPPLPYKLLGTYEQGDNDMLYLLVKGDRVYDVTIGDTLDGTYSVDGVTNGQLMFTYLPLDTSQGLRLGEQK